MVEFWQKSKNFREEKAMGLFDRSEEKKEKVYQEGLEAYKAEKYNAALQALKGAVEYGHAQSQRLLGFMYSFGHSIVKDGIEALRRLQYWLQKAAQNDDKAVAAKAREAPRQL